MVQGRGPVWFELRFSDGFSAHQIVLREREPFQEERAHFGGQKRREESADQTVLTEKGAVSHSSGSTHLYIRCFNSN